MFLIQRAPVGLRKWAQRSGAGRLILFRSWPRRHWALTTAAVIVLVAGPLAIWQPWQVPSVCGPGLTQTTSSTCVGLDLESTPLRPGTDPLVPLEQQVGAIDNAISGQFVTIVMLENLTPNPATDTIALTQAYEDIEGSIIAIIQANHTSIADGQTPQIKLLLANLGSDQNSEKAAVGAIEAAAPSQHISAVTGIEQSLSITRAAVTDLSDHRILTVGAIPTADSMRLSVDPGQANTILPYYYQVSPTNTEEVEAALNTILNGADQLDHPYQNVVMIADQNPNDDYAQTLQKAFTSHRVQLGTRATDQTIFYDSDPALEPPGVARADYVKNQFSQFPFHAQLCQDHPDMVYFAGRGDDLQQLITALEGAQPCSNPLTGLDIITGDDGSNLVGRPLTLDAPVRIRVYYTGLAAQDEWQAFPTDPGYQRTVYQPFRNAFTQTGFHPTDLADGEAMMHYDAVLTTATAIRLNASSGQSPSAVVLEFNNLGCGQGISGASGYIAYTDASNHAPYDKAMPVMQITTGGKPSRAGFAWPTGKPLDRSSPSC